VDAVAAGVIVLAMLQGLIRGLARELGRLITVGSSLALGLLFYRPAALFLQTHSKLSGPAAEAISFTTLIGCCFLALLVGLLLVRKVVTVNLDIKGNKPGGILAGFFSAAGFVFCIFFAANLWPDEALHKQFFGHSILGSALSKIMPAAARPAVDSEEENEKNQVDRKDAPEDDLGPAAAPDGSDPVARKLILDEPPIPKKTTRHR
jgi:hypothetical protein